MLCYKDKTWCPFWKTCADGKTCPDALTPQVKQDAEAWMTHAPIAVWTEKPMCWKEALCDWNV